MPKKGSWDNPELWEKARRALGGMVPDRVFMKGTLDEIVAATTAAANQLVQGVVQEQLDKRSAEMPREAPECTNPECRHGRREKD